MKYCAIAAVLAAMVTAAAAQAAPARVWQGAITLPTYQLGGEDPYPAFPLVDPHNVYPYTMLDDLTGRREPQTYRAIFLENEYLKATILPDVGGRLYSLYDKLGQREVFYRNHVVKYGLVGLRGAWISGGVEFNFPNGHTMLTVSPVDARTFTGSDGSATAVVGALDRVTGMHWEVWLTLRPGQACLEQKIVLFNNTSLPQLYWFWANAAVPATQDMQFIYPMREVNPHSWTEIRTYPVWRGVDYSWYRDFRQPTSLFGVQVHRDFFGAYYHRGDYGVVHVADFRQDPGKKIWSWGTAGDGLIWTGLLTDQDGPYNEIQSGRYETQLTQEFLPARRVESWTEYWYPVRGLQGGFVAATRQLALNVKFAAGEKNEAEVALQPVVSLRDLRLQVRLAGRLLREFSISRLTAGQAATFAVPIEEEEQAQRQLAVEVKTAAGQSLLHWSAAEPVDGNPNFVSHAGEHPRPELSAQATASELLRAGVEAEKQGKPQQADRLYQQALEKDPGSVPALLKLAERDYQAADFAAAEKRIVQALERDRADPNIYCLAGTIYRQAGQTSRAQDALWNSIHFGGRRAPALEQLGEIAIGEGQYKKAEQLLQQALRYNPDDALARAALATAWRRGGEPEQSRAAAQQALAAMPLLPAALAEAAQDKLDTKGAANTPADGLQALGPTGDVDTYLSVAGWYRGLGDLSSADSVLRAAAQRFAPSPLVYAYLAADAWQAGHEQAAAHYAAQAAAAPCGTLFPHRVPDAQVLSDVLAHDPRNTHALLLRGDFLFARGRYDDAAADWRQAAALGLSDAGLQRNLGLWAWRVRGDRKLAAAYYEKAIQLAPQQYRLYPDLDEIYTELGDNAARDRLYADAPPAVRERDTVRLRQAELLVEQQRFDDALALLRAHPFKPWEGGQSARSVYVLANVERGRLDLREKRYEQAEQSFRLALQYPAVLGVGQPDHPHDQEAQYWLGEALSAQGKSAAARAAWQSAAEPDEFADSDAALFRAAALQRLGHSEEAGQELSRLASLAEDEAASAQDFCIAGRAQHFLGQQVMAERDFRAALQRDPGNRCARLALAPSMRASQ